MASAGLMATVSVTLPLKPDAAARGRVAERLAQQASFTRGRTHEAHRQVNGRGLPRSIGTKEPEDLALVDGQ